jgi:hypothetical protein
MGGRAGRGRAPDSRSSSEYEPSAEPREGAQYKLSESKNVPKIYGQSIFNFARRHRQFVGQVLARSGGDAAAFDRFVQQFKNSTNSIEELRRLWLECPQNRFSREMRVISAEFLRKQSLSQIFNSRIENFGKHLKYRRKMLEAISRPQLFTQMKDF